MRRGQGLAGDRLEVEYVERVVGSGPGGGLGSVRVTLVGWGGPAFGGAPGRQRFRLEVRRPRRLDRYAARAAQQGRGYADECLVPRPSATLVPHHPLAHRYTRIAAERTSYPGWITVCVMVL